MNKNIKKSVSAILEKYPRTRDDDRMLYCAYLSEFHNGYLIRLNGIKHVSLHNICELPSFESISRCRRKFQEDGLYPASVTARERRKNQTEHVREIILDKPKSIFSNPFRK